jgi:hypothetical integral membrane protein (TIGR02206 family)
MPWFMAKRNKTAYQVFYYWVIAGTTQAILTPYLFDSFPHYTFLKYFILHCGLVIVMLYATFVFGYRPSLRGVGIAYLVWQCYFLVIGGVNYLLKSNYLYICRKPPTASLLDKLGDWPVYLITGQLMIIGLFLVAWIPFAWKKVE